MPARALIFLFVLLSSFWLWKMLGLSIPIFSLVVAASAFLAFAKDKTGKVVFLICFSLLLLAQWTTTKRTELTKLSNDEERIQQTRMIDEYPPVYFTLFGKTVWPPLAHWLEERKEAIAFYKTQNNLGHVLDFNLYFFANHPRERVGVSEFEKFPYLFIPFFLAGLLKGLKKPTLLCWVSGLLSIVIVSLIGHQNPMGPFSLLPFFVATLTVGAEEVWGRVKQTKHANIVVVVFFITLFLNIVQQYAYTKF